MNGQLIVKRMSKSQKIAAWILLMFALYILSSILIYTYFPSIFFLNGFLNGYHFTTINEFTAGPTIQIMIGLGFLMSSLLLVNQHCILLSKIFSVFLFFVALSNQYRFHFTTWFIPKPLFFFLLFLTISGLFYSHNKKDVTIH